MAEDTSRAEEGDVRLTEILNFLVRVTQAVSGLAMFRVSTRDTPDLITSAMLLLMSQVRLVVVLLSALRWVSVRIVLPIKESSFLK